MNTFDRIILAADSLTVFLFVGALCWLNVNTIGPWSYFFSGYLFHAAVARLHSKFQELKKRWP